MSKYVSPTMQIANGYSFIKFFDVLYSYFDLFTHSGSKQYKNEI